MLPRVEQQDYRTTYELEGHNWWFVGMRRICLALLGSPPDETDGDRERILDVGCGTGIMLEHLQAGRSATGLDFSVTALEFCRQRRIERLVQGRGEQLPFADSSFAAVTAFGVVEHIEDDRAAVGEWARVLQPGGVLVLLTSAYQWLWSGHDVSNHHTRRYVTAEIEHLLIEAGLQPTRISYVNSFLFPPILVVRIAERIRRRGRPPIPRKDTGEVPPFVNRFLVWLLDLERRVIERRSLPFGVSIVASARKV